MEKCVLESEIRRLPVVLTEAEKIDLGEKAGRHDQEQRDFVEEKKAAMSRFKGLIEQSAAKRQYILQCLASGKETRDVQTEVVADFSAGMAVRYRLDTGEEIGRRPLTGGEMQRRFDFEGVTPLSDSRWAGLEVQAGDSDSLAEEGKDDAEEK